MPKIKTLRRTLKNAREDTHFINNYTCNRRNGLMQKESVAFEFSEPKQRFPTLKLRQAVVKTDASEDIECSSKLFPHLIHICDLTKDFIQRAAKVIKIPQHQFSFERLLVHFKVHRLDTFNTQSMSRGQARMPFTPTIYVCKTEQTSIRNGVLFMGEKTFKKTKSMLSLSSLDTISIRSAITDPEVRAIHEALTELLETPVWELLVEIKQNVQMSHATHQLDMLSMELDILLNTVKHVAFNDIEEPESQVYSDIPDEIKDYLLRKREINGFGIWNVNELRVFVNHENKRRHLRENMLKVFTDIFKTKLNLQVMVGKPCIRFYSQQGDKIYTSSPSAESNEENSYGTLGGFVTDQNNDTLVLTCSHVCKKGDIIFADDNNSGRERIGECVFSCDLRTRTIDMFIDVALVNIDNHVLDRCNLSMMKGDNPQPANVKIYFDKLQTIARKAFVYKIGASTHLTKGLIASPENYHVITGKRAELFFISSVGDIPFAKEGDSGSIVFMIENTSAVDTINVIGMVSGGFTPNQSSKEKEGKEEKRNTEKNEGAKADVSCSEDIACFRMDKTMEFLNKKGMDICFKNQI